MQRAPGQPPCAHGVQCYRKNALHWEEFDHPADHPKLLKRTAEEGSPSAPPAKKAKEAKEAKEADDPPPAQEAEELSSSSSSPAQLLQPPSSVRDQGAVAVVASSSSQQSSPAVLVFAPGASGSTAQKMRRFQDDVLTPLGLIVSRCDDNALAKGEARWTCQQVGSSSNLRHLLAVVGRAAAAHPGCKLFLAAASFGCRVAAEALRTHGDELRKLGVQPALISCGYPLISPGKPDIGQPGYDAKRPASLLNLPATVRVLLLQGTADEYNGPRGIAALKELIPKMSATAELVEVPNGTHGLPTATRLKELGKKQADVDQDVGKAILEFVNRF